MMREHLVAWAVAMGLSSTALAADLSPLPPVVPAAAPGYNWTGFYLGGNVGGAWRSNDGWTDSLFGLAWNNTYTGTVIGGGQVGFNVQYNQFVFGAEWDADWIASNTNNSIGSGLPGIGIVGITGNDRWISVVAARFGVAWDRALLYGKAGLGWVGSGDFVISNVLTGTTIIGPNDRTNNGWALGAGIESAFAPSWSVKLEYDYLGLNGRTFTIPFGSPFLTGDRFITGNRNIQIVKLGVNYLFNWAATPRY
jgi:outer membrane immunogenic protein